MATDRGENCRANRQMRIDDSGGGDDDAGGISAAETVIRVGGFLAAGCADVVRRP